jgi:enoyl reductase
VTGSSDGGDAKPLVSSDAKWTAPPCWYEPYFTPDEFKAYIQAKYDEAGQSGADTVYDYYYQVMQEMEAIHYHDGDDGKWWMLVMNDHMPEGSTASCPAQVGWQWVDAQNPAPAGNSITPEMLSQVAYGATKLPSRKVKLSPAAANQVVNLATYAKFADPINRVWVTAQLANAGIAATVVAVPDSLRIDAGTDDASPKSCTYDFTKSGNTYQVDTSKADCNITYRKSTSGGSYTLTSRITWKVTWTATATPDGATAGTLPDGYSDSDQNVQVKEIQTVNR